MTLFGDLGSGGPGREGGGGGTGTDRGSVPVVVLDGHHATVDYSEGPGPGVPPLVSLLLSLEGVRRLEGLRGTSKTL